MKYEIRASCLHFTYIFILFNGAPLTLWNKDINFKLHIFSYLYRLHWQVFKLESIHSFKPTDIWCIFNPHYYSVLVLRISENTYWRVNVPTREFNSFYHLLNVLRKKELLRDSNLQMALLRSAKSSSVVVLVLV